MGLKESRWKKGRQAHRHTHTQRHKNREADKQKYIKDNLKKPTADEAIKSLF